MQAICSKKRARADTPWRSVRSKEAQDAARCARAEELARAFVEARTEREHKGVQLAECLYQHLSAVWEGVMLPQLQRGSPRLVCDIDTPALRPVLGVNDARAPIDLNDGRPRREVLDAAIAELERRYACPVDLLMERTIDAETRHFSFAARVAIHYREPL